MLPPKRLRVHGLDLSYFTGKLEAYLRNKGVPYDLILMNTADFKRCGRATGVAQMPQVEWAEGTWLSDTTLILPFLETQYTEHGILPVNSLQAFVAQLMEDFGDEWLWRPALYYRWAHSADSRLLGQRLAETMMSDIPLPKLMRRILITNRQRLHFMLGDGWTPYTAARIQQHYLDTLRALERIFQSQPFVLGHRPTLADYGMFGSMFRHFFSDPTPARIMQNQGPGVMEWVSRLWNTRLSELPPFESSWDIHPATSSLFDIICDEFLPYMQANETAHHNQVSRFTFDSDSVKFRIPTKQYRAWRYQRLRLRYQALSPHDCDVLNQHVPKLGHYLSQRVQVPVQAVINSLPITPGSVKTMVGRSW